MDSADTTAHARARRRKSRSTHGSSSIYRRIGGFFPSFPTTPPLLLLLFLLPFCLSLHRAIPSAFLGPSHTCFVARHRSPCPTPPFHNFHVVTAATSLPTRRTHTRARGDATFLLDPPQRYQSSDWVENLQSLLDSRIAKRISGHLWFNTAWAGAVTALFEFMPQWHIDAYISPLPHQLMSSALGLLLVFRTKYVGLEGGKVGGKGRTVQGKVDGPHKSYSPFSHPLSYPLSLRPPMPLSPAPPTTDFGKLEKCGAASPITAGIWREQAA